MPLGLARGAAGVEDVQWMCAADQRGIHCFSPAHEFIPSAFALAQHYRLLRTLQGHHTLGLMAAFFQGRADQRLVRDHLVHLDPARGGEEDLRLGIVDADGQFVRREATEHHAMHHAEPSTGQHGDDRFGHHGHVDHGGVALRQTSALHRTSQACNATQ
jgi:hypothetical protein